MYNLTDRSVVLGVSGSIAAYKAADLASKLTQAGVSFDRGLPAGRARRAEAMLIAPASATTIARLALGLAEDMVSLTALATRAPIIVCPAMDNHMYEHEATQAHLETLRRRGAHLVGPEVGRLASGHSGPGRMSEGDTIIGALRYVLGRGGDLAGKKVVVSAGGTQEPIDPVRYVGNYSSGKLGYALAEAARDRSAATVLVRAPRARAEAKGRKTKRQRGGLSLSLVRTPDVLAEVGRRQGLVKVGFAAESEELLADARREVEPEGLGLLGG